MPNISTEVYIYQTLKARIMEAFGLEDGDEVLAGTLEGESPLPDIIAQLVRDAERSEAFAEGIKAIMKDNQARKQRLETRAEKLRDLALWAMLEIGLPKIEKADMTISKHMSARSVIITDETAVPLAYSRVETAPDKTKIKEAMKRGEQFAFAEWSNPHPVLTVRTK